MTKAVAVETGTTLEVSRRIAASPERVFDAWTTKAFGNWLPPGGATCKVAEMDVRVGGRFALEMLAEDKREVRITGEYKQIDRPNKLVMGWTGCGGDDLLITVTFEADGDGTLMKMRQEGFSSEGTRQGYLSGWTGEGGSFDKLQRLLES